jgi:hypothetical protein
VFQNRREGLPRHTPLGSLFLKDPEDVQVVDLRFVGVSEKEIAQHLGFFSQMAIAMKTVVTRKGTENCLKTLDHRSPMDVNRL